MESTDASAPKACDKLLPAPGFLVARGLGWTVIALIVVAGFWCSRMEVQVVVKAPGRLAVRGESIQISVPEEGVVAEIPVQVGQRVAAGDLLVRLDSFNYESQVMLLELDLPRLRLQQQNHLESAQAIRATLLGSQTRLNSATERAQLLANQLDRTTELKEMGIASIEACEQAKAQHLAALAEVEQIKAERELRQTEAKDRERLAADAAAQISSIEAKQKHLRELIERLAVRATVGGVISDLAIRNQGITALPGQPLVTLIPEGKELMAQVEIPNRSLRGVTAGLTGRIAVEAFPTEDFGFLDCKLDAIEPDAQQGGGYVAWLSLRGQDAKQDWLTDNLRAGLEVQAELVVEKRTLANLLLAPLRRLMSEPMTIGRP